VTPRTLFVGRGATGVAWYRIALPAMHLGADWVGLSGDPTTLRCVTGSGDPEAAMRDIAAYDVVVLQQPQGPVWLDVVRRLQAGGTRVIYEIDDWLQGVRKQDGHGAAGHYSREAVQAHKLVIRACDAVICSTPWLARRYRAINPAVSVCRNGVDLPRYALSRPERDHVAIGWAGGDGHVAALDGWLEGIVAVMEARPETRFVSVGLPYADVVAEHVAEDRCLSIPFGMIETYPAAMTHFDIAIAPSAGTNFYRGKSDLRWLEAAAMGLPVVADPIVYPEIQPGVTGLHADDRITARDALLALVDDAGLRARIGAAARAHVTEHRDMATMAEQWRAVITGVAARPAAAA
jgi:glycosyltransferase involved in cell wall biosynthesis